MPAGRPKKPFEETQEGKRLAKRLEKEEAKKVKAEEKEEKARVREMKKVEKEEKKEKRRNCGAKAFSLPLRWMSVPDAIYLYIYIF